MTRMNWDRVRREEQFKRAERYSTPFGMGRKPHTKAQPIGFRAKFAGRCANCHAEFPTLTFVRFNKNDQLVHGRGCPKKSSQTQRPSRQVTRVLVWDEPQVQVDF